VTKGVDVPTDSGDHTEGIFSPPEANRHLVDYIFVVWSSFVGHAPTSIDQLKLFILDVFFDEFPLSLVGIVPPSIQEGHLDN